MINLSHFFVVLLRSQIPILVIDSRQICQHVLLSQINYDYSKINYDPHLKYGSECVLFLSHQKASAHPFVFVYRFRVILLFFFTFSLVTGFPFITLKITKIPRRPKEAFSLRLKVGSP